MTLETVEVWVPLLNEGTVVSRPTKAERIDQERYRILPTPDYDPEDEEWEYPPGTVVRCRLDSSEDGSTYLLAVQRATAAGM